MTDVRDLRFEWPQLRRPMFLIVDDPAPCLNLAHYEQYFEPHVRDVPNSFTNAWADLIEEFGVRGKFSVLPVPAGIGRIDRPLPGVKPSDQAEFLRIARDRISPRMDICIEFLTHFLAWDIHHDRPLDYTEKTMGPFTSEGHLTEYFTYGLRILDSLGLSPTGATSPGAACCDIEGAYSRAIRDAVREARGLSIAWYFLHVDVSSPVVLPRLMSLNENSGQACVSLLSAGNDPSWQTQRQEPSNLDMLITADGQSGRLVELFRNGSPISFHTHWQSLFSEGRATGLTDFRVLFGRIREHFGERALWTKCSDLARVWAAQAATRVIVSETEAAAEIRLRSPIACPDFTVSVRCDREAIRVYAGAQILKPASGDRHLQPDTWRHSDGVLSWCAALPAGEVVVRIER
ncbi:MAG TPA: hypothetical protein VFJ58_26960 [Armatimonadota bacterium]|nr:hypothetical protein [Armatimonadota bacterium]